MADNELEAQHCPDTIAPFRFGDSAVQHEILSQTAENHAGRTLKRVD